MTFGAAVLRLCRRLVRVRVAARVGGVRVSKQACVLCGKDPATGWAAIGDDRYCHGDDDEVPTCYMRSQGALLPKDWLSPEWLVEFQSDATHGDTP